MGYSQHWFLKEWHIYQNPPLPDRVEFYILSTRRALVRLKLSWCLDCCWLAVLTTTICWKFCFNGSGCSGRVMIGECSGTKPLWAWSSFSGVWGFARHSVIQPKPVCRSANRSRSSDWRIDLQVHCMEKRLVVWLFFCRMIISFRVDVDSWLDS